MSLLAAVIYVCVHLCRHCLASLCPAKSQQTLTAYIGRAVVRSFVFADVLWLARIAVVYAASFFVSLQVHESDVS